MKNIYSRSNVYTCVTAEELINNGFVEKGIYGYFAHDIHSLKRAVEENKQNRNCFYGRLSKVLSDENRARFVWENGDYIFSLFYPTDWQLNKERF